MRVDTRRAGAWLLSLALAAPPAQAHDGRPLAPHDLWSAWSWEPAVMATVLLSFLLYFVGVRSLWRAAGAGRGVRRWEAGAYLAGWTVLALALVSPLHAMGGVLFSAHMAQHELLMLVAAPLLVLGRPLVAFAWALPPAWRPGVAAATHSASVRSIWHTLTRPFSAWALHAVAIWAWHLPRLYETTLRSEGMHALQHASFVVTALLFWWAMLRGRHRGSGSLGATTYVFTTAIHTGALGALLTFAPSLWYRSYAATTAAWGLTPLEDQQLAGLIMWVPPALIYLAATLALFARVLQVGEADGARGPDGAHGAGHARATRTPPADPATLAPQPGAADGA